MKISMMSYTIARGEWGQNPDIVSLCELTKELGLEAIDWVSTYGKDPDEIVRITGDYGIKNCCHTFGARLQVADEKERAAAIDVVKEGLETAAKLGTDKVMVVLSGIPGVPREETRTYAIDSLQKVVPMGQEMGIAVSVEHFPGATSPFAISADMNEAIAQVPGLKITYDNGNVFIGGEPMKPATNRLRGLLYSSKGAPTCSMLPAFSTTILSAMVMASTWSCVT